MTGRSSARSCGDVGLKVIICIDVNNVWNWPITNTRERGRIIGERDDQVSRLKDWSVEGSGSGEGIIFLGYIEYPRGY